MTAWGLPPHSIRSLAGCSPNASSRLLEAFGFVSVGLAPADFERPDQVVQLGLPPVRVDLITSITGVSWEEACAGKTPGTYGAIPVYYLGREQFLANKRATGRRQDLADLEALGEA